MCRGKPEFLPAIAATCPPRFARLIAACLSGHANQRPTASNVVTELNACYSELKHGAEAKAHMGSHAQQPGQQSATPPLTPAKTMQNSGAPGHTMSQPFVTATQAMPGSNGVGSAQGPAAADRSSGMPQGGGSAAPAQAQAPASANEATAPNGHVHLQQVPQGSSAFRGKSGPGGGGGIQTQPVQSPHYGHAQSPPDARVAVTAEVLVS